MSNKINFPVEGYFILIGAAIFGIMSSIIKYWSETKEQYYLDHPESVPEFITLVLIFIGIPVLAYSIFIAVQGLIVVFEYYRGTGSEETALH
ncbi:MAG: hypothetical protein INQ03_11985 [Candidatus Heimdallarchaeota archaeon]|nr:hypothetical protein [Candidatus Heimdallarchaeota archaeon]